MTKREMFTAILNGEITDEVLEQVKHEIELMDSTNAKRAEMQLRRGLRRTPRRLLSGKPSLLSSLTSLRPLLTSSLKLESRSSLRPFLPF